MEPWQLAILAVPAVVLLLSVVMIILTLFRISSSKEVGRRVAAPDEDTGPRPEPGPPARGRVRSGRKRRRPQ